MFTTSSLSSKKKSNQKSCIIKISLLIFISCFLNGCMTYHMGGKVFSTKDQAYNYQNNLMQEQVDKIEPATYFGASLLIHMPSDTNLIQAPFVTGIPTNDQKEYFLVFYKNDFKGVKTAIEKAHMFDSINLIQRSSYLKFSKTHGYRYLLVNNGDGTWTIFDIYLDLDKTFRFPKGLDNLVYTIEDAISKFENKKSTKIIAKKYKPLNEKLKYNDLTRKGLLSIQGKGIEARSWMLAKIGEIASSKNILLKAGEKPKAGYFNILNESLDNNIFTIEFETIY
jgi:hypothetical protein